MNQIQPLTDEQIQNQPVPQSKGPFIVRFLANGQVIQNLRTGILASRGSNIIYHTHFWDVHNDWIYYILDCLRNNNPSLKIIADKKKA